MYATANDLRLVIDILKVVRDKNQKEENYVDTKIRPSINRVIFELEELIKKNAIDLINKGDTK